MFKAPTLKSALNHRASMVPFFPILIQQRFKTPLYSKDLEEFNKLKTV